MRHLWSLWATRDVPVSVVLPGVLHKYTGEIELETDVANVRQLFNSLRNDFRNWPRIWLTGMPFDNCGAIYQDALFQPIPDGSEVHLIPKSRRLPYTLERLN